jgi:hypothetical protein
MQLLSYLTQKHDIATAIIRHSGKDGFGRGSSAFEGEADLCISISRRGGNHPHTQRHLTAVGRYGEWERIIELKDRRYISHGDSAKVKFNRAVSFIMAVLPESPGTGLTKKQIMDARRTQDELSISAATIERALKWLCDPKQGKIGMKQQMHLQGKPKVYWKAAQI